MDAVTSSDKTTAPMPSEPAATTGDTKKLLSEVAGMLDDAVDIDWRKVAASLCVAFRHRATSDDARLFLDKYAGEICGLITDRRSKKFTKSMLKCMTTLMVILKDDLVAKSQVATGECKTLGVLATLLRKEGAGPFAERGDFEFSTWTRGWINYFRDMNGFHFLGAYLSIRASTPAFPPHSFSDVLFQAMAVAMKRPRQDMIVPSNIIGMELNAKVIWSAIVKHTTTLHIECAKTITAKEDAIKLVQVHSQLEEVNGQLMEALDTLHNCIKNSVPRPSTLQASVDAAALRIASATPESVENDSSTTGDSETAEDNSNVKNTHSESEESKLSHEDADVNDDVTVKAQGGNGDEREQKRMKH